MTRFRGAGVARPIAARVAVGLAAAVLAGFAPARRALPPGALVSSAHAANVSPTSFEPTIPKGLSRELWWILVPPGNPVTADKVALGRRLFFDPRLSRDGTVSCATCHDPARAFTDGRPAAVGIGGGKSARNTPTILNAVFSEFQFWDGRASTLEEQAKTPLVNALEMGFRTHDEVSAVLQGVPEYRNEFRRVFGRAPSVDDFAAAVATFERAALSGNSPFDRFSAGERRAISDSAVRGFALWNGKAKCGTCHPFGEVTPNLSDNKFHNLGVGWNAKTKEFNDLGRFAVSREPRDRGAFKTPSLRDVALTAPYMHDGSQATLHDVVEFYDRGGEPNPFLDPNMNRLGLSDREKADLLAFMNTLSGEKTAALGGPRVGGGRETKRERVDIIGSPRVAFLSHK